jgi:hypothetical protein
MRLPAAVTVTVLLWGLRLRRHPLRIAGVLTLLGVATVHARRLNSRP